MKQKSEELIVCCSQRLWIRLGMIISVIFIALNPDLRNMTIISLIFLIFYITRMPNFCVFEDGIQISIFTYKNFIEWNKIRVVRVYPQQFTITIDFPIPIYVLIWRKNYSATLEVLESKLGDKVKKYPFPLPF